jgi:subtilisin-like proprotein convertase family protein
MRKIYIALLSLLTLFIWNTKSAAQISTYVFLQSNGTYTENTDAGRVILGTTTNDDQVFNNNTAGAAAPQTNTGFPIGFNFTYNGIVYDKFAVSANGWMVLGTGSFQIGGSGNYTPLSLAGPAGYVSAIGALARDLQAQAGAELSYQTLGTAPNRTLVVQWKGYRRFLGAGQNYNFQIVLTETTNTVQVVYGTFAESSATDGAVQVGLRGATNADFNNRTGLWATSTAGGTNAASMSLSTASGAIPTSGLTYTWLIPPPCVAPPGGGTTTGPSGTVCPGVNFVLGVSGSSFGTGLTYQWEFSPDGISWSPVLTGGTGLTLTTSITVNTYFRRKITCSGIDGFSTSLLVNVSPPIATPFTENFAAYATTFPPTCWTNSNATFLGGLAPSAYGVGAGSARFNFFSAGTGTVMDLGTVAFNAVPANYRVTFDHAYATFTTEVDQLQVLYSTNGGVSYTNLATYLGGTTGPLNTFGGTGATTGVFTPTAAQWATKAIALPVGTNKIVFRGISGFGNNLFIDNVTVEPIPSCLPPTGLTTTAIGPTTATLSWTASPTNPSNGYQWEVRTSGAPGSGATGLAASGVTGAGVTTANVTGLTANTAYSYYVRSDCGVSNFSSWSLAFAFTTPCNAIGIPFTETFSTYATTFPPTCWTRNNATFLAGNAASAYGVGSGSAKFDFYNANTGTNLDLVSPLFTPVPANHRVTFDHAYATFFGEVDQLQIFYSTDGGATYTSLITYNGGTNGPLNTGGSNTAPFTPTADQWANKAVDLPTGTNRLRFRGISAFGNNMYLDNITVEPTPSCLPVTNVKALAITPTSVIVSFTPPLTGPTVGYIVEYGTVGFIPGTTNTAGGGTVTFGAGSPITVTGLTASTAYDFYVRRICIAGVDYSTNVKATATTLCPATNIPYLQNFETSVPLTGFPTCTTMEDVNGNSGPTPNGGGGRWITNNIAQTYVSPTNSLWYIYDLGNAARGGDDWFYLQGLNLTAGTSYRVKAYFKGSDAPTWIEKFEIKYGTAAYSASMTNLIYSNSGTSTNVSNPFDSLIADFTPSATGVYYIGFHNISDPDQAFLFIDDISVKVSPKVDVGITGLTLPSLTCPTTNGVFVQATIKNYNTVVQNFATYPVTVTANITGALTATLTATLNTGTLAPGASMGIYLSPAFNFSAGGLYNITTATSSPDDPETGNNAYTTSVNVNSNPANPAITPALTQLCLGGQVQLNTQFTASPPPVTMPAFSSGTISIPVPDGSAVGATHTLSVTGVPAGATITAMSVTLNMTHTWAGDMIFNLKAPNGNILNLDKYIGGTDASGANFVNTVISSATGLNALTSQAAPRTGTFRPDAINDPVTVSGIQNPNGYVSNAAAFADLYSVPNGSWTLAMADGVGFDAGTLTSWSITITYQILTPAVTWTPVTGLFTNATATTAYTAGTDAYTVYSKPATTGTYVYTATATTLAGCTASGSATVIVNGPTAITVGNIPDTVCISDQVIPLVASPTGGSWSGIGVSGTNFIPPATAVGTYTLTYTYTNSFGCTTTATKKIAVKDCPERYILLRDDALALYPNPNNGLFNIRVNTVLYNYLTMKVYTNTGVLVRTQQLGGLTWGRVVPIDLTNLPGGVYMVKFYYDGGVRTSEKTFKVIIGLP